MAELIPNAQFRPQSPLETRHVTLIADTDILQGQPIYVKANGRAGVANAAAIGTAGTLIGIATRTVKAGRPVEAAYKGKIVGYDNLEAQPAGTRVFVSATAPGQLATTAPSGSGKVVAPIGIVLIDTHIGGQALRYILFDIDLNAVPVAL